MTVRQRGGETSGVVVGDNDGVSGGRSMWGRCDFWSGFRGLEGGCCTGGRKETPTVLPPAFTHVTRDIVHLISGDLIADNLDPTWRQLKPPQDCCSGSL